MEWMARFVCIMNAISTANEEGLSVTMLANETGLSKGTLYRILQDMVKYRLIVQNAETKKYNLGPLSIIWGSCFVKGKDVSQLLSVYCDEIAEKTRLYSYLCRFTADEVYCIYTRQPAQERKTYFVHVGQRMPLHATASAKAILAFHPAEQVKKLLEQSARTIFTEQTQFNVEDLMRELAEVRKTGIAWCRDEIEPGVSAISIPLFSTDSCTYFSLSLVGNSGELKKNSVEIIRQLKLSGSIINDNLSAIHTFSVIG